MPELEMAPIRVMLVDDSVVARSIFSRVLGQHRDIEIVCEAADGDAALAQLNCNDVDIILLDIEMPKRSGLDALPDILVRSNGARILVVSAFAEENGSAALNALSLGACDTLAKPGKSGFSGKFSEILIDKVVRLGRSRRNTKHGDAIAVAKLAVEYQSLSRPECIAIGASTGGIPPIYEIIRNLVPALDCPIFITQHLPDAFMSFFARQLGGLTERTVSVATAGEVVKKNHIYIAPGDAHLTCRRGKDRIIIDRLDQYSHSRYCPSVDAMFASLAGIYGAGCMGMIFSGMGNDGAAGASDIFAAGGTTLVQDVESSVVWGMPGAVAKAGCASAILSPAQMTELLGRIAKSR
ncbi:chemotaxis-specific protein-glutamate methyltransferase CheB [Sphingorhabdus sp. IMCC26285]|uniref:protein-glutamate methylesterase n=1 Tax=Sphingorhabdus profundilacus TaxID=2509718 RepID=A0A6I4LV16_9SPHN|nr:chemotaxis-specific protein-glutamate methyltransferase CheB [Sphingorhabdus profundilacus]